MSPKPPLLSPAKVIPNPPRLPPRSQAESRAACRAPACRALGPASPPASPCCNQRKKRLSVPAHPPSARELPAAVGASLPSWGAGLPRPAAPGAFRAVLLPQQGAHPQLLQGPGAAEREEKQRQAPLPPPRGQRRAPAEPCPVGKDTGAGGSPGGQDRGAAKALAPSRPPFGLPFWGPAGDAEMPPIPLVPAAGMPTPQAPPGQAGLPPSLPACCPLPARALHGGQSPFTGWRGHGWEPLLPLASPHRSCHSPERTGASTAPHRPALPWDGAPRLTRKWQGRSRWARRG